MRPDAPESLLRHLQAVCAATIPLARAWGADASEAALAALLHDVARDVDAPPPAAPLAALGLPLDPGEAEIPELWHAPAAVLRLAKIGVSNPHVLAAVRFHTTGRPAMTPIEAAVLVGDRASEDRPEAFSARLREDLSRGMDMRAALRACLEEKIRALRARGVSPFPRTEAALADVA